MFPFRMPLALMLLLAVASQMTRNRRGCGIVIIKQQAGDGVATLDGKMTDEPVHGPVANLRLVGLREFHKFVVAPAQLGHLRDAS